MAETDPPALIDKYVGAYNAFDIEGMLALLSPDIRFENYSAGQLTAAATGIDEFRQLAEQAKVLFSEREQRVTGLRAGEHSTIAEIAYRGRLAVDIPDGPVAGAIIDLRGTTEFSFADNKISRIIDRS